MGAEPNGRPKAVDSYEGESAVVLLLIRPNELALHESRIGVEVESAGCSGFGIRARPTEIEVDLTDKALEVGYGGRIAAARMSSCGICGEGYAGHRAWEKEVSPGWTSYVRNRQWGDASRDLVASPGLTVALVGVCGDPYSRAQHEG